MRVAFVLSLVGAAPLALGAAGAFGCSSSDSPATADSGAPDTGASDGGAPDGAQQDGAQPDAGEGGAPDAQDAGPSIWPVITNQGGMTMAPLKLVTIVASNDADAQQLFAFGDAVGASRWWMDIANDYNLGAFGGHTKWTGAAITGASITDTQMAAYIRATIAANNGGAPDARTLYLLYLPDGTNSASSQTMEVNTDCATSTGYHTWDNDLVWSVVERCPVSTTGWTKFQGVTQTAAHEIAEAATDPLVSTWFLTCPMGSNPWDCSPFATGTQGEVGDLCPETRWDESGFVWSRIWSKGAAAAGGDPCVPRSSDPYETATTAMGWYTVAAGASVTIPVTGWSSTGSAPDWNVRAAIAKQKMGTTFTIDFTATTLAVGQSVDLKVNAPQGAPSGAWAVVQIDSAPTNIGTSDPQHQWFVGVRVP